MTTADPRPPRLARWLLRLRPLGARRAEVEADLAEVFAERSAREGLRRASVRYYMDVLSLWKGNGSAANWASGVVQDLSHAGRMFRRSPGAVAVTVVGLSLAIAVSTAVFSLLNAAVFRGVGVADPDSAVRVLRAQNNGINSGWTFEHYLALRENAPGIAVEGVLRDSARFSNEPASADDGGGQPVSMTFVSASYLATFGAAVSHGRALTAADDTIGAPPVVVVSHGFWARRLAADPAIAGRRIWLNGVQVTVVGVTARSFTGIADQPPAFWSPFAAYHVLYSGSPLTRTSQTVVNIYGRVPRGARLEKTEAELGAVAAALGSTAADSSVTTGVRLESAKSRFSRPAEAGTVALVVAVILAVIGLVLVLACVNVANLQLASALARHREIGVRRALGASRARIVRQLLTESLALGVAGGAVGLLLSVWLLPILIAAVRLPVTVDVAPDFRVYAFLALVSVAAGIGAGFAPARHGTSGDLMTPLKGETGRSASSRPGRLRATLIGVQAGASILLLILAALLTRAAVRATRIDVGFDPSRLVTVTPAFGREQYDEARARVYWQEGFDRIRALPGVEAVTLAHYLPYGDGQGVRIEIRNGRRHTTFVNHTDADYFSTLGLRPIRGRTYTAQEVAANAPVVVISESLARDFWPAEDPVGLTLERMDANSRITIIGIVSDAVTARLRELGAAALYRPIADTRAARILIRTRAAPEPIVPSIRDALQPLDVRVRLDLALVSAGLQRQLDEPRIIAAMGGALAALALGLAVVGIYGVTSFVAGQRTREIGLRLAIGATAADVMRLLLFDSLRPVGVGLAAGAAAALLGTRVLAGLLYGVGAHDPIAFGAATLVLLVSAAAAVYVPTRRAARLDPASVLRQS